MQLQCTCLISRLLWMATHGVYESLLCFMEGATFAMAMKVSSTQRCLNDWTQPSLTYLGAVSALNAYFSILVKTPGNDNSD